MNELDPRRVQTTGDFWAPRLEINARSALLHQWEQLELSGCIQNFRLLAEGAPGFHMGWFFADSDAYKWLDAAARTYARYPLPALAERMDTLVELLAGAQAADGYLFTYNQLLFPGTRWTSLQIEHELYCHGHLIEAGIAHHQATGQERMLEVAHKAADRLVADMAGRGPDMTPGHEEVEIALLKLFRLTGRQAYLDLARQFLEQRGRQRFFARRLLGQNLSTRRRGAEVERRRAEYLAAHPEQAKYELPASNTARKPPGSRRRFYLSALSGRLFQQHRPVREQREPVGHAVRFAYLQTALAMLYRVGGDESLLPPLEAAWEHMVNRRMYVTGGVGSVPDIEGFGRDYELDPEYAYAETCAALGCLFWNWEMTLITGEARYAELFEWQLYNAAAVGMGLDGRSYLYNNPLACRGGVLRRSWYQVPCCPSNLSRTLASLGGYVYAYDEDNLWVHQYIGSEAEPVEGLRVEMKSGLPWQGKVRLRLFCPAPTSLTVHLRLPSWTANWTLRLNGEEIEAPDVTATAGPPEQPASGYRPQAARYLPLSRTWSDGDTVELDLPMPITVRTAHRRVKSVRGRVALTRGPLVYCLESADNVGLDPTQVRIDPASLQAEYSPGHFGGVWVIAGRTLDGDSFTAIPYAYWANRGESHMAVWLRTV